MYSENFVISFDLPDPKDNIQNDPKLLEDHLSKTLGKVITRFPPEPNGFLHIGHAKAMFINFMYAKSKNGFCYLRFDDTNPSKEKKIYIDSILEDVNWLGHSIYKVTYTSDYFDQLYYYALELIRKDKAYVCELNQNDMQEQRYKCIESPYRNRPISESVTLFEMMKNGKIKEGEMSLRLKCDMKSDNPNMRDLVAYRIILKEHPRTGNKWVIYPTYDFSHPIIDSLENITHSLCSMEFKSRNELYRWVPEMLEIYRAPQIEYSRLNLSHTVLSKRKLIQLVDEEIVLGWDDPRMPTIKGLKRRGYTPTSINNFANKVGMGLGVDGGNVSYNLLEECLRMDLEQKAPRIMAILHPLKITFLNLSDEFVGEVDVLDFPNLKEKSTSHKMAFTNSCYIDALDFREKDSPDYYRLAPNKIVRLRYAGLIRCIGFKTDYHGNPCEIYVELLSKEFKPDKRVKGTINWVCHHDALNVEIRQYDHLFPKKLEINEGDDWKKHLNMNSLKKINALTDPSIKKAKPFDKFQFERIGYFSVDPESTSDKIIMNMCVGLKEDKNKNK